MRWPWNMWQEPLNLVRHKMLYPKRSMTKQEVHELKKRIKRRLSKLPKRPKPRVRYRLRKQLMFFYNKRSYTQGVREVYR